MEIAQLLLCITGSIGMTQIVVESEISNAAKKLIEKITPSFLMKMLNCYQCSGFWCGIFMGMIFYFPENLAALDVGRIFAVGCSSSALSYFWAMFLMYLEANTTIKTHE